MCCPTFLLLQCSPPFPEEPRFISMGQLLSEDSKMVKFDACKRVKFIPSSPLFSHLLCLSNSKIVFFVSLISIFGIPIIRNLSRIAQCCTIRIWDSRVVIYWYLSCCYRYPRKQFAQYVRIRGKTQ